MIPYQLRPYTQSDFEFVYKTKKEAYKGYVEKFWGTWDEEKQRLFFTDFMDKFQKSLLIIECEGIPVGIYHGERIDSDTYEIGNIIIVPDYQGQGIGTSVLLNIIKKYARLKIRLQVFKGNPAIALYERLGFTRADETRTHLVMQHE